MSKAIDDIAAERQRQIASENWTAEHDDTHDTGELAIAAACYAVPDEYKDSGRADGVLGLWPWCPRWWKPTNRRRDLVKAGALIAAEIERLDRQRHNTGGELSR